MWFTKQADGFRVWFAVKTAAGALRTGIPAAQFTATAVNPADSAGLVMAVVESATKPGVYRCLITTTFLTTHGNGEYGVVIELAALAPALKDVYSGVLTVTTQDFDTISVSTTGIDDLRTRLPSTLTPTGKMRSHVESMDADVVGPLQIASGAFDADALAASAVTKIQAGLAQATGIDDLRTRLPATLTLQGRMRAHVESMANETITAAVIASGAITADKIATNAIDADALASDAVAEIQAGLAMTTGIDDLRTRLPSTLTPTGRMRSQVEGMDLDTITAGVIATDAVGALELSADAIAEIQAGLAQATGIDDLRTRLPSSLTITGRMRSQVEGIDPNVVMDTAIAPDAIGAEELAASAVAKIVAAIPSTTGIAGSVWEELRVAHGTVGSFGERVNVDVAAIRAAIVTHIVDGNTFGFTVETTLDILRKILNNRLELADGSTSNWVLYDDDDATPVLTYNVKDKGGGGIVQPTQAPSRRTRGV